MLSIDFNKLPNEFQNYLIWNKGNFIRRIAVDDNHIIVKYRLYNFYVDMHYIYFKGKLEHISNIAEEVTMQKYIANISFEGQFSLQ